MACFLSNNTNMLNISNCIRCFKKKRKQKAYMDFNIYGCGNYFFACDWLEHKVELNYPGKTLTAFSLNDSERHKIVTIELRMEDGSVYSVDEIKDEYGRLGCFIDR